MLAARGPDQADATLVPTDASAVAGAPARTQVTDGAQVPVILAGYEVIAELGRGGMGVVYKARQVSLNRAVALKMILAGYQAGPRDRARFRAEAAAVARVQHPHIVQVYEVGEDAGRPYLALELVNGTTLQHKLAGAPQPPGPAAHLVELLARAVHHAHQSGVVHRDLKPQNVLLASVAGTSGQSDPHAAQAAALYGVPKVTDFGLAKQIGGDDGQTKSGELLGTPSYMAPEQAAGKAGEAGPATDVYALGAILYEMLTGRPPFHGATPLETLHQVLHDEPVPPGRLRQKLPRDLERICLKCLEKDPRKRYASAQDLADDLRRHQTGESVLARPAPVPERVWRWCRRNPIATGLLVSAVLGSVSGLWYLSWLTRSVVESTALHGAEQQSRMLDELNQYYGEVARNVGPKNQDGRGWETVPGKIPFPATVTHEITERITERGGDPGAAVRLYSDYPFAIRPARELDGFEREALAVLRANDVDKFVRFEVLDGRRVLRYATPRRMTSQTCVKCHNNYPNKPEGGWKVGDVRGVLEVIRPLDRDQERVSQGLRGTALLIGGLGVGAILLSAATLAFGNRPRRPPPDLSPGPTPDGPDPTPLPGGTPTQPPRGETPMPSPRDPDPVDATLAPSQSSGPGHSPDPEGTLLTPATGGDGDVDATMAPPAPSARAAAADVTLAPPPSRATAVAELTPTPAMIAEATLVRPGHADELTVMPVGATAEATLVRPTPVVRASPADELTVLPGATTADATLVPPPPADELTAATGTTTAEATLVRPSLVAAPPRLTAPTALRTLVDRGRDPSATDADVTRDPDFRSVSEADATRTFPSTGPGASAASGVPAHPDATVPSAAPAGHVVVGATGVTIGGAVNRYVLQALHARGGLGEVFTARDTELNREVALKRIQSRYADDPSSRRRFLSEAELTARLDHPGVVPVFGLVADGRGRPCYAMRFIRGESLRDEIDRYYQRERTGSPRPATGPADQTAAYSGDDPAARNGTPPPPTTATAPPAADKRIAFRQLLQRFIAVCQAIAYAHTRRVIHRDIKPANVMVGTFGETLVVDWGLAKALDDVPNVEAIEQAAERAGFRRDPTATAVPDDHTAVGTAVGTPAYMSPEQAFGHIDQVGPASDIYSLGATLYCILTGKAPFGGPAPTETIKQVQKGEFSPPRALNPDTPPPLDAVCRKAMAVRIADRYATAQELAADVERWLSDEPVSCYRDPAWARFARWARRNPARVAGTVSLLVTGLAATAVILFVVDRERQKTKTALNETTIARNDAQTAYEAETKAKAATEAALVDVRKQKVLTEEQRDAAAQARDLAHTRFGLARAAFETVVFEIQGHLADRAGTQKFRQELLRIAQAGLQKLIKTTEHASQADRHEADRLLVWARLQMGDVYKNLGDTAAARAEYTTAVGKAEALLKETPGSLDVRRDLAAGYDRKAEIDLQAGKTAAAFESAQNAFDVRERLFRDAPKDPAAMRDFAASRDRRAVVELEQGHTASARTDCDESLALRKRLWEDNKTDPALVRDLAESNERAAEILLRVGDTAGAAKAAGEAVRLLGGVAEAQPENVEAQRELAAAYSRLGEVDYARADMEAARTAYRDGLTVLDTVLAHDQLSAGAKLDAAVAHGRLGFVLLRTGKLTDALTETRLSNQLCKELVANDPDSAKALRALASSHEYLGDALLANGRAADAIAEYDAARKILEGLLKSDTGAVRVQAELAQILERTGVARLAADELTQAMDAFTHSAVIRDGLAGADPTSARARQQLGLSQDRLCEAHLLAGNHVQARVAAYKAFAIFRALAANDPGSGEAKRNLATAYAKWGEVALEQNDVTAATILAHKSLAEFDAVAGVDETNAQAQADRADALEQLATVNGAAGYPKRQLALEEMANEVWKKQAGAARTSPAAHRGLMTSYRRLGDVHVEQREFDKALQSYKNARAVAAEFKDDPVFKAEIGRVTDRLELLDAIRAGTKNPAALAGLPPDIRARALAILVFDHIRLREPGSTVSAAEMLGANARGPDDLYLAAYGCAAAANSIPKEAKSAKEIYARSATGWLIRAAEAGYRKAGGLADPVWNSFRDEKSFQAAEAMINAHLPLAPAPRAK